MVEGELYGYNILNPLGWFGWQAGRPFPDHIAYCTRYTHHGVPASGLMSTGQCNRALGLEVTGHESRVQCGTGQYSRALGSHVRV